MAMSETADPVVYDASGAFRWDRERDADLFGAYSPLALLLACVDGTPVPEFEAGVTYRVVITRVAKEAGR